MELLTKEQIEKMTPTELQEREEALRSHLQPMSDKMIEKKKHFILNNINFGAASHDQVAQLYMFCGQLGLPIKSVGDEQGIELAKDVQENILTEVQKDMKVVVESIDDAEALSQEHFDITNKLMALKTEEAIEALKCDGGLDGVIKDLEEQGIVEEVNSEEEEK